MTVKNPDGSEQSPEILENFDCLQQTGDFCSNSGPGGGMASLLLDRLSVALNARRKGLGAAAED